YGGINEAFAELYAKTRDERWLRLANRFYDRKVLDPLAAGADDLADIHSNTQIPKIIGLARIHELADAPDKARTARFFWSRVVRHHSFAIGGNGDREYFFDPDSISKHITEQTCEHCATYNMLKLTQHLFAWAPDGALMDFYERAHLNHVMAAHHPVTGSFTYMTPLMSGAPREWSNPKKDPFWCCVGSGMESHSKHGVAIFSEGGGSLLVNLFIPAKAEWEKRGAVIDLNTRYPMDGEVRLALTKLRRPGRFLVALRIPQWAADKASIDINGKKVPFNVERGYALIDRFWKAGDVIQLNLPLELRIEPTPDNDRIVAILRGPLVLAGDLGPSSAPWEHNDPALVGNDILGAFVAEQAQQASYRTRGIVHPADLRFVPFFNQYDRRSAIYFTRFTPTEWEKQQSAFASEKARQRELEARSVDSVHLGENQSEHDHQLRSNISYPVSYRWRKGRDARSGGFFEFSLKTRPGPLVLEATYWGDERPRDFDIFVDDVKLATQHLGKVRPGEFFDVDYQVPRPLTDEKSSIMVRFVPHDGNTAGPVFGVRLLTTSAATTGWSRRTVGPERSYAAETPKSSIR
ncbi:MAG TPA: beta-L-arabinofuranosidase domain-containing protein, partial [Sphingomicrobium sp.]|nr:beta-L-arabinofuranosidase domain-containing protein [Sphingomicrobium sp.]